MKQQKAGHIINVSSVAGQLWPLTVSYTSR
jgi:hypothetical protein